MLMRSLAWVTIAATEAVSNAVNIGEKLLCGVQMPAAWTAADLTFEVSLDGVTWKSLTSTSGAEITVASPAAGALIALDPSDYLLAQLVRVRSGTAETPVAQAAERQITLVARKFYPIG